jgi:hypothetical protein
MKGNGRPWRLACLTFLRTMVKSPPVPMVPSISQAEQRAEDFWCIVTSWPSYWPGAEDYVWSL